MAEKKLEKFLKEKKPKESAVFPSVNFIESHDETKESKLTDLPREVETDDEIIEQRMPSMPVFKPVQSKEELEAVEKAEKKVTERKSKKKKIINTCFMIANIIIVVAIIWSQSQQGDGIMSFGDFWNNHFSFAKLLICILIFVVIISLETIKMELLIRTSTGKNHIAISYKSVGILRYYDSITPMATGGQAFQVFYLKSKGVPTGVAISAPIGKYVFQQVTWVVLGIIIMITFSVSGLKIGSAEQTAVTVGGFVGLALNAGLIAVVALFSINRKASEKVVGGILSLLKKMRIIKNKEKVQEGVNKTVGDFQSTFKFYAKKPLVMILEFLFSLLQSFIHYSIPFFIYCLLVGPDLSLWMQSLMVSMVVDLAASFFPMPGGTGVAELSFTAMFADLFKSGLLFWALIIWRVLTYYAYVIQGPIILIYDYLIGNKRNAWRLKKAELEADTKNTFVQNSFLKRKK